MPEAQKPQVAGPPDAGAASLHAFLAGTWHLDRLARDRRAGVRHVFTGTALATPEGDGLLLDETVAWQVGGQSLTGHRRLHLAFPAPWRAVVRFADGRFFHNLDLTAGVGGMHHDCPPDRYRGRYRLLGPDAFRVLWLVRGPRKDLVLATDFRRAYPQSGRGKGSSLLSEASITKSL